MDNCCEVVEARLEDARSLADAAADDSRADRARSRDATSIAAAGFGGGISGALLVGGAGLVVASVLQDRENGDFSRATRIGVGAALVGGLLGSVGGVTVGCDNAGRRSAPAVLAGVSTLLVGSGAGLALAAASVGRGDGFNEDWLYVGAAVGAVGLPVVGGVVGAWTPYRYGVAVVPAVGPAGAGVALRGGF